MIRAAAFLLGSIVALTRKLNGPITLTSNVIKPHDDLMKKVGGGYSKIPQITIITARQQFEERREKVRQEIAEARR